MSGVLGLELYTAFNTGTMAVPVWDEIGPIKDESLEISKTVVETTTRLANGWKTERGALKKGTIDIQLLYLPLDADFIVIKDAFFNDTKLILGLFDGDVSVEGTYEGLHSAMNVVKFSKPRKLDDVVVVDTSWTLDLEDTTNTAPLWETIVTPAP